VAAAQDRAEVSRVGDSVDGNEKGGSTRPALDHLGEFGLDQWRGERDHTLRGLAASLRLETLAIDLLHRGPHAASNVDDVGYEVARGLPVEEIRRHPHFADLATAGDQQLANRLTTFDLFAAPRLFRLALVRARRGDAARSSGATRRELPRRRRSRLAATFLRRRFLGAAAGCRRGATLRRCGALLTASAAISCSLSSSHVYSFVITATAQQAMPPRRPSPPSLWARRLFRDPGAPQALLKLACM